MIQSLWLINLISIKIIHTYKSLLIIPVTYSNIETIRARCTYLKKRLIYCSPKHLWEDTNNQYKNELSILLL